MTVTVRGEGEPWPKHVRITGPDRARLGAELKRRYEQGASLRTLAEDTGRSYGFVHRVLSEQGVVWRPRGSHRRTGTRETGT